MVYIVCHSNMGNTSYSLRKMTGVLANSPLVCLTVKGKGYGIMLNWTGPCARNDLPDSLISSDEMSDDCVSEFTFSCES